jgi:hypothetical protein
MAAKKKKIKSQAKPKRPAPKPKAKAKSVPKRAPPKAKAAAAPKKPVQTRVAAAKPKATPQPQITPAPAPKAIAAAPPQPPASIVRPGLQKRPDAVAICVVTVTDGDRLIEESTFYSTAGRDEYVQRWEARGYTCRFTRSGNGAAS